MVAQTVAAVFFFAIFAAFLRDLRGYELYKPLTAKIAKAR